MIIIVVTLKLIFSNGNLSNLNTTKSNNKNSKCRNSNRHTNGFKMFSSRRGGNSIINKINSNTNGLSESSNSSTRNGNTTIAMIVREMGALLANSLTW